MCQFRLSFVFFLFSSLPSAHAMHVLLALPPAAAVCMLSNDSCFRGRWACGGDCSLVPTGASHDGGQMAIEQPRPQVRGSVGRRAVYMFTFGTET